MSDRKGATSSTDVGGGGGADRGAASSASRAERSVTAKRRPAWRRALTWKRVLLAYAVLLIAHQFVVRVVQPDVWGVHQSAPADAEAIEVVVPSMRRGGPVVDERDVTLAVHRYASDTLTRPVADDAVADAWSGVAQAGDGVLPVILLHGSPSQGARDFDAFARLLAIEGRTVYAVDRPGYGRSSSLVPSFAAKANAWYVLAVMDELDVERAHLVGWSYSGAVVVHAAGLAPERIASITMLGAMATQEGEGSGSYFFEHLKHALGFPLVVALPEVIPHFGLLGPTDVRHAFIQDFWDTDLRPVRAIMEALNTPTLIVHGRHDPLVPATTAELHHELAPNSRLVMLDGSHFFPLGPPMGSRRELTIAAASLSTFLATHDAAGVPVREGVVDLSPAPPRKPFTLFGVEIDPNQKWWLLVIFIIIGTFVSEDLTVIAVGLAVAAGAVDPGVAILGCFLGIVLGDYGLWAFGHFGGRRLLKWPFMRRVITDEALEHWSKVLGRHTAKAVFVSRMLPGTRLPLYIAAGVIPRHNKKFLFFVTIAVAVWTPLLLLLTFLIGPPLLGFFQDIFHGPWAVVAAFIVLFVLLRIVSLEATDLGRQRLKADVRRFVEYEFWPSWVFYAPLVPWLLWLSVRHRGVAVFTAANPGLPNGGGFVGEPKTAICHALAKAGGPVLHAARIDEDPDIEARLSRLKALFNDPACPLDGYPVVLKPEAGQRGFGVNVIEDDDEAREYFDETTVPVQAQKLAAEANEVGVLWSRTPAPANGDDTTADDLAGEIFSVTCKTFPVIEGDGEQTLEQLIWDHPRYRMQAKRFVSRWQRERDRVLNDGERFELGVSGNHAQGTMFTDGSALITPELTAAIDRIAQGYRDPDTGQRIDFGRFDLRYRSDEELKRGGGFSIIELNGTSAESTNIYDPNRSIFWTYGVLFRQWSRVYQLGAIRRGEGVKPLSAFGLLRLIWRHFRSRRGDPLAD